MTHRALREPQDSDGAFHIVSRWTAFSNPRTEQQDAVQGWLPARRGVVWDSWANCFARRDLSLDSDVPVLQLAPPHSEWYWNQRQCAVVQRDGIRWWRGHGRSSHLRLSLAGGGGWSARFGVRQGVLYNS